MALTYRFREVNIQNSTTKVARLVQKSGYTSPPREYMQHTWYIPGTYISLQLTAENTFLLGFVGWRVKSASTTDQFELFHYYAF